MDITAPVTDYIADSLLTTKGDLIKQGAAIAARFGIGSAGYMARVNAAGDDLAYEAAGAFAGEDEVSAERSGNLTITGAYQTLCQANLGTIALNERWLVFALCHSSKDATPGELEYQVAKLSGTGTIVFIYDKAELKNCVYHAANAYCITTIAGIMAPTGAGTMILGFNVKANAGGGTSYSGNSQIYVTKLVHA